MRKLSLKRRKFFPFIIFVSVILLSVFSAFYIAVSPAFSELAESSSANHLSTVLHSAILSAGENHDFSDLAEITKDGGKVTSIVLNSKKANEIRSLMALKANSMLSSEEYSTFRIPLGNITKIPLLSGRGYKIPLKIVPMGNIHADIYSDFTDAGINQTKYSVYVKLTAKVRLMSPFCGAVTSSSASVPLTETIIVGDIPHLYASGEK